MNKKASTDLPINPGLLNIKVHIRQDQLMMNFLATLLRHFVLRCSTVRLRMDNSIECAIVSSGGCRYPLSAGVVHVK